MQAFTAEELYIDFSKVQEDHHFKPLAGQDSEPGEQHIVLEFIYNIMIFLNAYIPFNKPESSFTTFFHPEHNQLWHEAQRPL